MNVFIIQNNGKYMPGNNIQHVHLHKHCLHKMMIQNKKEYSLREFSVHIQIVCHNKMQKK